MCCPRDDGASVVPVCHHWLYGGDARGAHSQPLHFHGKRVLLVELERPESQQVDVSAEHRLALVLELLPRVALSLSVQLGTVEENGCAYPQSPNELNGKAASP